MSEEIDGELAAADSSITLAGYAGMGDLLPRSSILCAEPGGLVGMRPELIICQPPSWPPTVWNNDVPYVAEASHGYGYITAAQWIRRCAAHTARWTILRTVRQLTDYDRR